MMRLTNYKQSIPAFCVMLLLLFLLAEGVARFCFLRDIKHLFPDSHVARTFLYLDGFVAQDVRFNDNLHADKLYLQGNPFRLAFSHPQRIWIGRVDYVQDDVPKEAISWPVPSGSVLEIDHLNVVLPVWNEKVMLSGSLKQDQDKRAVFSLRSKTRGIKGKLQGELILNSGQVDTINLDYEGYVFSFAPLDARRVIAWASLVYHDDWQLSGEANAGALQAGQFEFLDSSLKISRNLHNPRLSFSGVEKTTAGLWVMEAAEHQITLDRDDKQIAAQINLANKEEFSHWLVQIPPVPVKKAKTVAKKNIVAATISEPTPQKEATTLTALTMNTLLAGFSYSKPLEKFPTACASPEQSDCWISRAVGGIFQYDPDNMPPYLQRLKDYEQAMTLRRVLQHVAIDMIHLTGHGNQADQMVIKGISNDQPVYIELSVGDVE